MTITNITPDSSFPPTFPTRNWNYYQSKYREYMDWYDGTILSATEETNSGIEDLYPMQINIPRILANKIGQIVLGQLSNRSHMYINPVITPAFDREKNRKVSDILTRLLGVIWRASDGASIQVQGAIQSQYMGGQVLQVRYDPARKPIPFYVSLIPSQYVLPVWRGLDYATMEEAWISYMVSPNSIVTLAPEDFTNKIKSDPPMRMQYTEHWTKTHCKIYANGELISEFPHFFGEVPIVYIPRFRSNGPYGYGISDDIGRITLEYNIAVANAGDYQARISNPLVYGTDLSSEIDFVNVDEDHKVAKIGDTVPHTKATPSLHILNEQATVGQGITVYPDLLWSVIMRLVYLSPIQFGENAATQRSSQAASAEMNPAISYAQMWRAYANEGYSKINKLLVRGIKEKSEFLSSIIEELKQEEIPDGFDLVLNFDNIFTPINVPDIDTAYNRLISAKQAGLVSDRTAIEELGLSNDPETEIEMIRKESEAKVAANAKSIQRNGSDGPLQNSNSDNRGENRGLEDDINSSGRKRSGRDSEG